MNITHVPISRVEGNRSEKIVALFAVFLLGVTVGSIAVLAESRKLKSVSVDNSSQLGAVVLFDIATPEVADTFTTAPVTANAEPTPVSPPLGTALADARSAAGEKAELTLEITDRTIAIDRLNQEIERTKNASVLLIAEFNTNCANWNDVCATPYVKKLDENNTTYNNFVVSLNALQTELGLLKTELESLSN